MRVRVDGGVPVAVLCVRRSETNRPSKCLEDTRGELARKGLTHRRTLPPTIQRGRAHRLPGQFLRRY